MVWIDPNEIFHGVILLLAPHMDDDVLACGGTIARLQQKECVHLAYATDGGMSPVPAFPWQGPASAELPDIRRCEARNALQFLGVPDANVYFLDLPDGRLNGHLDGLRAALLDLLRELAPDVVLVPFRYDRHPDHLALHRAAVDVLRSAGQGTRLVEYFVYYRWQLLPGKDLRAYLRPDQLLQVDITDFAGKKKQALDCFRSQTTRYFEWQTRPILPLQRVAEVSRAPEIFVEYNPAYAGARVFRSLRLWIRTVHVIEPPLKQIKEWALTLLNVRRSYARPTSN